MKFLETAQENAVYELFPTMHAVDLFETNTPPYITYHLSVFDHWLTEEEATDENAFSKKNLRRYKDSVRGFYFYLFKKYKLYSFFEINWGGGSLLEFTSKKEFSDWVEIMLTERMFLRLVVPELKIMIVHDFDYTLPLFLSEGADVVQIEELVAQHELYLLK